jgi:hypothetical protein
MRARLKEQMRTLDLGDESVGTHLTDELRLSATHQSVLCRAKVQDGSTKFCQVSGCIDREDHPQALDRRAARDRS